METIARHGVFDVKKMHHAGCRVGYYKWTYISTYMVAGVKTLYTDFREDEHGDFQATSRQDIYKHKTFYYRFGLII